ncbi:MAG: DUF983 domain-containing protein [Micropepsaceae bacterium]
MTATYQQRSVWDGLKRGFFGRCPNCGEGELFLAYLKVAPACPACGHALAQYRADDGPAYFTILIVGHLLIAPLLLSEAIYTWPLVPLLGLFAAGIIGSTLALLPRVKGAFVGVQWAVGDSGGAHSTEPPTATVPSTDSAG